MGRKVEVTDELIHGENEPQVEDAREDNPVTDMAADARDARSETFDQPRRRRMTRLDLLHVRHDDRGGKWWTRVGTVWFDTDSCDFAQLRLDVIPVQYNNSGQIEIVAMPPRPRSTTIQG